MKIALLGYGKMGQAIEQVIIDQKQGDEIVLKISSANLSDLTIENLQKADVAIEFSTPHTAIENIYKCFKAGVPVVVGSTAWLSRLDEVKAECSLHSGSLFFSPNFSVGVNIFWEINRKLAELMNNQPQYHVAMEEIHHTEKLDAPSGTAVKTAEVILEKMHNKKGWSLVAEGQHPAPDSLLIVAKREPNVPGTHVVTYTSSVDYIEIKHEAKNRRGFAEGAVLAARWLPGKKGVFEMKDLLAL